MARAGLLIAVGTLDVLVTIAMMCLEIVMCVNAKKRSSLAAASGVAAAIQSAVFVASSALLVVRLLRPTLAVSWTRSTVAFVVLLSTCLVALATSTGSVVYLHQSELDGQDDSDVALKQRLLTGTAIVLVMSAILQFGFVALCFTSGRPATPASSASSTHHLSEEGRSSRVKGLRYSRTMSASPVQELRSIGSMDSSLTMPEKAFFGPIGQIRASVSQAIRPTTSKSKLVTTGPRRPISVESVPPCESPEFSFDSWDTSLVDPHNRQTIVSLSSSPTARRTLETIPGSRTPSRPSTPFDLEELVPPRRMRTMDSFRSSIHSQYEANGRSPRGSINELDIHPLFRSTSITPPPAASAGTSVVAAPNAGQVISRKTSAQSLKRLRSGSLPVAPSPLVRQISSESLKMKPKTPRDEGDLLRGSNEDAQGVDEPSLPEWRLSPRMKASLESFKERTTTDGVNDEGER
ncbi:hypothetical protein AAL_00644 [Moelleriella libera RCEF 2490]|uniref:Uncharacterized protein n=1 Tax=Moelleriella libera RCEF 2490 TaxID=1081109 RepID=A0A166V0V8_9HYPO|nr:hypothetical protein AAL_00644 [Moelleriella libera RCEF 2490]